LRSFIAIELPESVRTALSVLQQDLKTCGADVRWVKPEGIHLTLKFLGEVKDKDVDRIVEILEGTCKEYSTFHLEINRIGTFPGKRSPRVLWVGISGDETLAALKRKIDDRMSSLGFEKEERPFSPHLTLGRFKSSAGKEAMMQRVDSLKDSSVGKIEVTSISLMRSDLGPAGATYTKIGEFLLNK